MTIAEQIIKENEGAFESIKDQLRENVLNAVRKYGHHTIYFDRGPCAEANKIELTRYPNGSDCTKIHINHARTAVAFLEREGLRCLLSRNWYDDAPNSIEVSL